MSSFEGHVQTSIARATYSRCSVHLHPLLFRFPLPSSSPYSEETLIECESLLVRGDEFFLASRFSEALDEYTKALRLNPKHTMLHHKRALTNFNLRSYGEAVADASEALRIDPNLLETLWIRQSSLRELGRFYYGLALADLKTCFQLQPDYQNTTALINYLEKNISEDRAIIERKMEEYHQEEARQQLENERMPEKPKNWIKDKALSPKFKLMLRRAQQYEAEGNIPDAISVMSRLLKSPKPSRLEDLCYTLKLYRQQSQSNSQYQRKICQLDQQIAKRLGIDSSNASLKFKNVLWHQIHHYLDYLIAQVNETTLYIEREFLVLVRDSDWELWLAWMEKYNAGWGYTKRKMFTLNSEPELIRYLRFDFFNCELAKAVSKETIPHRFFGGQLDTSLINPDSLYFLLVRAGLEEEDFIKGKYGFQDNVLVKSTLLHELNCMNAVQEMEDFISSTLKSAKEYYVALSIQPSSPQFKISQLHSSAQKQFLRRYVILGTIVDPQENRIYLCLKNDRRARLDLHEMSYSEASEACFKFLLESFHNFEDRCTVITGQGNHQLPNGQSGILKDNFVHWLKRPEWKLLAKRCCSGTGSYTVFMRPPKRYQISSPADVVDCVRDIYIAYRSETILHDRYIIDSIDQRFASMFHTCLTNCLMEDCRYIKSDSTGSKFKSRYLYQNSPPKTQYQTTSGLRTNLSWSAKPYHQ